MKFTPARKLLLNGIILALIIAGVAFLYVWMYERMQTLVLQLRELDARIASQHKEQAQILLLGAILQNHGADFDRLRVLRVSKTNPSEFLQKFEMLATRTKTKITIDLGDGGATGDSLSFRFTIEGAEENVAAMLALIEHAPYETTIDDISAEKILADPPRIRLIIGLHVKAF